MTVQSALRSQGAFAMMADELLVSRKRLRQGHSWPYGHLEDV